jgi:hypothetical protein
LFEDGCELELSENSSILFINSTFGQAPGISMLYFMCDNESEIFLSICDSTGTWKPDPADISCNSSINIPPTIPTTNSTDIDDNTGPRLDTYMPTMPRDLIPSFSLYVMAAGLVLLLFVMTLSLSTAIIWRWLKQNKNASITIQQVAEPIYESIMDDGADTQVNASYQVGARVDLTKNEAYASAGVVAQNNQSETDKPAAITMGTAKTLEENCSTCMEETIHSTHTCAPTVLIGDDNMFWPGDDPQ